MSIQDRTTLRSAYLYLVCLVTLIISIFAAVSLVRNTVQLVFPDPGYYGFEPAYGPDGEEREPDAAEQERREQAARESQRHHALLGLVGAGTTLLIAGPAYLYHWRRVQAEHSGAPAGAAAA